MMNNNNSNNNNSSSSSSNTYLLGSLILPEIRFVQWSIQAGARLSAGSLLFTYENVTPIDGKTKTFKYKCDQNGITVTQLCGEIKRGDVLKPGVQLFSYEGCKHSISTNDMCAICGIDLRKIEGFLNNKNKLPHAEKSSSLSSASASSSSAGANLQKPGTFKMIHTETGVVVDHKEALEIARQDLVNLVENKKLVLLVDLDHTLIHTTNERVSNELKEVYHYELGPRGAWYHTKFRPGYQAFLDEMHEMYQMHLITFGERKYAHMIAGFMDPDRKFFHDRILSRNEIFNPVSKTDNIKDLFPRGDLMVAIIDDREDVWNYARNLVCVQPYVFFKNTGDINDPHQLAAATATAPRRNEKENGNENSNSNTTQAATGGSGDHDKAETAAVAGAEVPGGEKGDNNAVAKETAVAEGTETKDEDPSGTAASAEQTNNGNGKQVVDIDYDPDDYLVYLKLILKKIHDEYYKIYETRRLSKGFPSINAANTTTMTTTTRQTKQMMVDEKDLPDLKRVCPLIKLRVLEGVVITFSGVIPTGYDLRKQRCYMMAVSLGAKVNEDIVLTDETDGLDEDPDRPTDESVKERNAKKYEYVYDDDESNSSGGDLKYTRSDDDYDSASGCSSSMNDVSSSTKNQKKKKRYTTHLVAAKFGTSKVHEALKSKRTVHVVTPEWLINCNYRWTKCDEAQFKLTKDYDYKNCLFHNEYNLHQKCAASRAASNNANNIPAPPPAQKPMIVECCPKFNSSSSSTTTTTNNNNNNNKHSLSGSSSFSSESPSKKYKASDDENEDENQTSSSAMTHVLDEELLKEMDKEVRDELEGDDDDDDENEDDQDEDEVENEGDEDDEGESSDQDGEKRRQNVETKKKVQFDLTASSSSSSSSSSSTLNDEDFDDNDSIDDEMVMALERDLGKNDD